MRTLESLARIELGAQGGALVERVTTTRTAKDGTATTTVRERFTAPDWHADGWFGLVSADGVRPARPHDQAKEADQPGAGDGRGAQDASIGCRRAIA